MIGCCCKRSTKWSRFFERISTWKVRLDTSNDGGFAIPTYLVYNRAWWKAVLWVKRLPNRIFRHFFPKPKIEFKFDKIMSIPFPVEWDTKRDTNYDIRSIMIGEPIKK